MNDSSIVPVQPKPPVPPESPTGEQQHQQQPCALAMMIPSNNNNNNDNETDESRTAVSSITSSSAAASTIKHSKVSNYTTTTTTTEKMKPPPEKETLEEYFNRRSIYFLADHVTTNPVFFFRSIYFGIVNGPSFTEDYLMGQLHQKLHHVAGWKFPQGIHGPAVTGDGALVEQQESWAMTNIVHESTESPSTTLKSTVASESFDDPVSTSAEISVDTWTDSGTEEPHHGMQDDCPGQQEQGMENISDMDEMDTMTVASSSSAVTKKQSNISSKNHRNIQKKKEMLDDFFDGLDIIDMLYCFAKPQKFVEWVASAVVDGSSFTEDYLTGRLYQKLHQIEGWKFPQGRHGPAIKEDGTVVEQNDSESIAAMMMSMSQLR